MRGLKLAHTFNVEDLVKGKPYYTFVSVRFQVEDGSIKDDNRFYTSSVPLRITDSNVLLDNTSTCHYRRSRIRLRELNKLVISYDNFNGLVISGAIVLEEKNKEEIDKIINEMKDKAIEDFICDLHEVTTGITVLNKNEVSGGFNCGH